MIRQISGAIFGTILFVGALFTPAAKADDDDPHAEYHPGGLPTKKDTPMKEAEKERKSKYEDLEMNKWPPDLWQRDKSKDGSDPD